MKKRSLIIALLSMFCISSFAQEIEWSQEEREKSSWIGWMCPGADGEVLALVKNGRNKVGDKLARYDEDLGKGILKNIGFYPRIEDINYEFFYDYNDKLLLLTSYRNRKKNSVYLFGQYVDKASLKLIGEHTMLAEVNYSAYKGSDFPRFSIERSEDESKLVVVYNLPEVRRGNYGVGVVMLDEDFNVLWDKRIMTEFEADLFEPETYLVADNGDFHLLGKLYDTYKRDSDYFPFQSKLLSYSNNGKTETISDFAFEGYVLWSVDMIMSESQDVICAGLYYQEDERYPILLGSYYMQYDPESKKIRSEKFSAFDFDFVTSHYEDRDMKKALKNAKKGRSVGLDDRYVIKEIVEKEGGGIVVIAEIEYREIYRDQYGNVTVTYINEDISVINLTQSGDILWTTKIPKFQSTMGYLGKTNSFAMLIDKDKLQFFYNEGTKGTLDSFKDIDTYNGMERTALVNVTVDSEGVKSKKMIQDNEESGVLPWPKITAEGKRSELFLAGYSEGGRGYYMGKITLD